MFVENQNTTKAKYLINANKKFLVVKTYESLINAENDLHKLTAQGINASLISKKDDVFLLGEHYIYVEESQFEKAQKILNS